MLSKITSITWLALLQHNLLLCDTASPLCIGCVPHLTRCTTQRALHDKQRGPFARATWRAWAYEHHWLAGLLIAFGVAISAGPADRACARCKRPLWPQTSLCNCHWKPSSHATHHLTMLSGLPKWSAPATVLPLVEQKTVPTTPPHCLRSQTPYRQIFFSRMVIAGLRQMVFPDPATVPPEAPVLLLGWQIAQSDTSIAV